MSSNLRIILASKSAARQTMLENVGLDFESIPAEIDEREAQQKSDKPQDVALALAQHKALAVSRDHPAALVIGSDQVLEFEGQIMHKALDVQSAREKLRALRGKTHRLISAVSIVRNGEVLWSHVDEAHLTMHDFDDAFLDAYCLRAGEALTACVGAYALEEAGSWLFLSIQGDFFTILGMPLLPLLAYLHQSHGVQP